jgi:hypothetical protein
MPPYCPHSSLSSDTQCRHHGQSAVHHNTNTHQAAQLFLTVAFNSSCEANTHAKTNPSNEGHCSVHSGLAAPLLLHQCLMLAESRS